MQRNKKVPDAHDAMEEVQSSLPETMKEHLPSTEDRRIMLQYVMAAASAVIDANTSFAPSKKSQSKTANATTSSTDLEKSAEDTTESVTEGFHSSPPPVAAVAEGGNNEQQLLDGSESESASAIVTQEEESGQQQQDVVIEEQVSAAESNIKLSKEEILSEERYERRIRSLLQDELFTTASSSLLLAPTSSNVEIQGKELPKQLPSDPFGCVILLLVNILLLSGEERGFDARVRQVIKTACVHIIAKKLEEEGSYEKDELQQEESESYGTYTTCIAKKKDTEESEPRVDDKQEETPTENDHKENKEMEEEAVTLSNDLSEYLGDSYENELKESAAAEKGDSAIASSGELSTDEIDTRHALYMRKATRKFESMESAVAQTLWILLLASAEEKKKKKNEEKEGKKGDSSGKKGSWFSPSSYKRENVVRGLKIGTVGLAAGTLFAVTGGMAAPGIAAGLAALGVGTSAAVVTLTSQAAIVTIFGVGGGGLAAYKMKRRTDGLSEFRIRKEGSDAAENAKDSPPKPEMQPAELHSAICVSGWLYDKSDFQRPWGVTPNDPPVSTLELLQRFYAIHDPTKIEMCETILEKYEGKQNVLWRKLEDKYGRDPDHVLPLEGRSYDLTDEETLTIQNLVGNSVKVDQEKLKNAAGKTNMRKPDASKTTHHKAPSLKSQAKKVSSMEKPRQQGELSDDAKTPSQEDDEEHDISSHPSKSDDILEPSLDESSITSSSQYVSRVVWDYMSQYRGDLYTITWESDLILSMCDYINDFARSLAKKATKYVLAQTAMATLLAAVAWPSTLLSFANAIDGTWTLATIRADAAGKELAKSLMVSEERRPVTLVGFSMGARAIFSCLKELSRHQELWEKRQNAEHAESVSGSSSPANLAKEADKSASIDRENNVSESASSESFVPSREPASIVEDVVLMGTPRYLDRRSWLACRRIVAGRFVNCYSRKDWILSLMYQYKSMTGVLRPTCGTSPVPDVPGVENLDVSDLVTWHSEYVVLVPEILQRVRYDEPRPLT